MPRRLNYTKRKKILRQDVTIRLRRDGARVTFDADLRLAAYGFHRLAPPPHVHVEAYHSASATWKRFDFGRADALSAPKDRALAEFTRPESILFRVKVSAAEGPHRGRLLGEADGLRPLMPEQDESGRDPIIHHVPADDIGDELWRVDFTGVMPLLKINANVPMGVEQFLLDPAHRAVFAPAVMRQVLTRILVVDRDSYDEEDDSSWQVRWLAFADTLPGVGRPPESQESDGHLDNLRDLEDWIDSAVEAFAASSKLMQGFCSAAARSGAP